MEESKDSLLSELLSSGGEIEGLFQQKKRKGLKNFAFMNSSRAFREPGEILQEQITAYNRRKSIQCQLSLQENEAYSGLLRFYFNNGQKMVSESIQVKSSTTALELVPELLQQFLPQLGSMEVPPTHHSYIVLMQGEMERELDIDEKPLQIALDCSTQGLASPRFVFKTSLAKLLDNTSPMHRGRFSSYGGSLAAGSVTNVAHSGSSEGSESPRLPKRHSTNLEAHCIGSEMSLSSLKSSRSVVKSTSSLPSKSIKGLSQIPSSHEGLLTPTSSPSHALHSPSSTQKSSRTKSVMSSFISRSLRVRKKSKNPPTPAAVTPSIQLEEMDVTTKSFSSLLSPLPVERKFTMSTIMHIYYTNPKAAQLYKSVLVSEKATTRDVIVQALERYHLRFSNPNDFSLYEVVGKWQDVTHTLPMQLDTRTDGRCTAASVHTISSPVAHRRMSVEEFVVCYTRELDPEEIPYKLQFYLTSQEGFTRRFDLRLKKSQLPSQSEEGTPTGSDKNRNMPHITSEPLFKASPNSDLCIFGETAQRKRSGKRNRVIQHSPENEDAATLHSDTSGEGETQEMERVIEKGEREGVSDRLASPEIPISVNPVNPPDFSALHCSSPDSGVGFHKDQSQPNSAKSSVSSEQNAADVTPTSCSIYPANLTTAFLLSLQLHNPEKDFLVHKLVSNRTHLVSSCAASDLPSLNLPQDSTNVILHNPEFADRTDPLCCICRQPTASEGTETSSSENTDISRRYNYTIQSIGDQPVPVLLNGQSLRGSATLRHGDLLALGSNYLFMFQDYASVNTDCIPKYNWRPHPVRHESNERVDECEIPTAATTTSQETSGNENESEQYLCHQSVSNKSNINVVIENVESNAASILELSTAESGNTQCQETIETDQQHERAVDPNSQPTRPQDGVVVAEHPPNTEPTMETHTHISLDATPDVFEPDHTPSLVTECPTSMHENISSSSSLPSNRKLMFSFHATEEDVLLSYLITRPDPQLMSCELAPAYTLAMCVEYSLRCDGPLAAGRFVKKAANLIQEVVWECTRKVTEWQPDSAVAQKPLSLLQELFPLLRPVFFWLANTLELYQFFTTLCDPLEFPVPPSTMEDTAEETDREDPLSTLYSILLYTFQQAFYSISKVLYHSLPVMLESCREDSNQSAMGIVIDQAVEFLQALLDLLTNLHVHLEVVSQFYANIFFFINAAMFNTLIDQGGELGLFQYTSGTALRANLNLLEGWACQVGFKDAVLHYLAKFSSTVDLLATPAEELLQLDWSQLRVEFPALFPAQLHYLLSNYLLPTTTEFVPKHWTPSEKDAFQALNASAVHESFEGHPDFELPTTGYVLDLNKSPPQPEKFQLYIETLRSDLKKPRRSVDIVPVVENRPHVSIPTLITEITDDHQTPPARRKGSETESTLNILQSRETLLDSSIDSPLHSRRGIGSNTESQEDLLEDTRIQRSLKERLKYHELSNESEITILNSYELKDDAEERTILESLGSQTNGFSVNERVERVQSMVAPRSYATPEKIILHDIEEPDADSNEWMEAHFPAGCRSVAIPRGDKGFGIILVEEKDPRTEDCAIFIQRVVPGSTAEKSKMVASGDRILAIDGQILDGADYLIAEKYIKEAEDDVSLVIAPTSFRTAHTTDHSLPQ